MIKANVALAENVGFETYEVSPIESFGKSILFKYAAGEEKRVGVKRKAEVRLIDYKTRNHRAGLGYVVNGDNRDNEHKSISKKKVNCYGCKVRVVHGKHKGLKGKIIDDIKTEDINECLTRQRYVNVQLKRSKEVIKVEGKNIRLRSHQDNEEKEIEEEENTISQVNTTDSKPKLTWIQQGLIVRIINKSSKYYNTKVKVEDLYNDTTFSLLTNDNVLHTSFTEEDCETTIPSENANVLILTPPEYKGQTGKLINRNKKANKVIIQLQDDLSVIELSQDDVCSFISQ